MPSKTVIDPIDAKILTALTAEPRATVIALADVTGLSRNTVQARLSKLEQRGVLHSFERRIDPGALGYPLTAFILTNVAQRKLSQIADASTGSPRSSRYTGSAVSPTFSSMSSLATPTTSTASPGASSTSTASNRPRLRS